MPVSRLTCTSVRFAFFDLSNHGMNAHIRIGIGRNLALNELRAVISKSVLEFDISFAPGETGRPLLEESKDIFTMSLAKLELRFTKRSQN